MEKEEFNLNLKEKAEKLNINLSNDQIEKFYKYMNILLKWNEFMNLTAITNPDEIILKHFIDSLSINEYINENDKIIDVGTGAGFPGIPLKIVNEEAEMMLLDSLNKRLNFLEEVIKENNLSKIETLHSRAEDAGRNNLYREKYDIAVSRAVAPMNILAEYLLPFVKIQGKCIFMKSAKIEEELEESKKAIELLGGRIEKIDKFNLINTEISRSVIIIRKIKNTPDKYPRKAGDISKKPI